MSNNSTNKPVIHYAPGRIRCNFCGLETHSINALVAPHPFRSMEKVYGCPQCKEIDALKRVCDVGGCWKGWYEQHGEEGGRIYLCSTHSKYAKGILNIINSKAKEQDGQRS